MPRNGPDTATQVKVVGIVQDTKPPILRYEPGHPDANEGLCGNAEHQHHAGNGEPDGSLAVYEANVAAFNASRHGISAGFGTRYGLT